MCLCVCGVFIGYVYVELLCGVCGVVFYCCLRLCFGWGCVCCLLSWFAGWGGLVVLPVCGFLFMVFVGLVHGALV